MPMQENQGHALTQFIFPCGSRPLSKAFSRSRRIAVLKRGVGNLFNKKDVISDVATCGALLMDLGELDK